MRKKVFCNECQNYKIPKFEVIVLGALGASITIVFTIVLEHHLFAFVVGLTLTACFILLGYMESCSNAYCAKRTTRIEISYYPTHKVRHEDVIDYDILNKDNDCKFYKSKGVK